MRRTLGGLGRSLITVGTLILLFVGYQLWGTGYFTAQEQDDLKAQLNKAFAAAATTTSSTAPATTTTKPSPNKPSPPKSAPLIAGDKIPQFNEGDPIGIIRLPWGDYAVVEGTRRSDLKKGPGHYPATVFPGQLGNAAIAGHRTTYLHPFLDLDTLHKGSEFKVDMLWGSYTYRVTEEPYAVRPSDVWVVETGPRNKTSAKKATLTLTACHPKYSARQRLIIQSELVVDKSEAPKEYVKPKPLKTTASEDASAQEAAEAAALQEGLGGDESSKGPALMWGIIVFLVGMLWWWVYRHWRHPITWFAGLIPFVPVLIGFYFYLERSLPSGY